MLYRNRVTAIQAATGAFLALTWITSIMRVYVKHFMAKSYALEDWLAMLASILFSSMAACFIGATIHIMGHDQDDIDEQDLVSAMQFWYFGELSYVVTICAIKISVAVFLLRIVVSKLQRSILYCAIGVLTVITITFFFVVLFQCTPISFAWNIFHATGACIPPKSFGGITYTHSAVNAAGDLLLAIMPIVVVSQLQMNPRIKVTVCVLLGMGLTAFIASIVRIPYLELLIQDAENFTYLSVNVALWSAIEACLAITAANMVVLRPLFSKFFSRSKLWDSTTIIDPSSTNYTSSKNIWASTPRRGYMRSNSGGNPMDLGLQHIDSIAQNTNVLNPSDGNGKNQIWNTDVELADDQLDHEYLSNAWPHGITKTVRLDVRSENGEETYSDILSDLNLSRGRPGRHERSGSTTSYPRDLRRPLGAHVRNESSHSMLTKLVQKETAQIFGLSQDARAESRASVGSARIRSPEPSSRTERLLSPSAGRKRSASRLGEVQVKVTPILGDVQVRVASREGRRVNARAGERSSQLSLNLVTPGAVGESREGPKEKVESPAGFGLGVWDVPEGSNRDSEPASGMRRASHAYQNSG